MAVDAVIPVPRTSAAAFCRLDQSLVNALVFGLHTRRLLASALLMLLAGSACYGFVFGLWRAPLQGVYSAVKMPALLVAVVLVSGTVNGMLAQILGARMSFRQVFSCILISMAIASILLGSLSPVVLFFAIQTPHAESADPLTAYGALLAAHTAVIGCCGILGTTRLYRLLGVMTNSRLVAWRVLLSWILVSGLVGCELSWVFSPFLARPDVAIPFLNPEAFSSNCFEYLWQAVAGRLT